MMNDKFFPKPCRNVKSINIFRNYKSCTHTHINHVFTFLNTFVFEIIIEHFEENSLS